MKTYNERFSRKEKIEEWASRGAEWCATQLWTARVDASRLRSENAERSRIDRRDISEAYILAQANKRLKKLLAEEGVEIKKLIVQFIDTNFDDECDGCGAYGYKNCEECEYRHEENIVGTFSFYTWHIHDGHLSGITKTFEDVDLEVVRIIDDNTGSVLYQTETENEP